MAGRPLLAWSVDAALAAGTIDRVIVSTDDEEIAAVGVDCGAEVPFLRPARLAADDTPDLPVFEHVLANLVDAASNDVLVHLRPTSPLRPPGLIDEAVRMLIADEDVDSVRSVSLVSRSPYKMWTVVEGRLEPLCGAMEAELFNQPRQLLPPVWQNDGVVDVVWVRTIRSGSMSGRRILPLFTPEGVAVDIDSEGDLITAEALFAAADAGIDQPRPARGDPSVTSG